jgi:uncharacterized protein
MSAALPEQLDAWRAVASRRRYEGVIPLSALPRLASGLADTDGEVRYALEFFRDEAGMACVAIDASTQLPLNCQRTLRRFLWPVTIVQRLGLIAREQDEAGVAPGCEPLLVPDGNLRPADLIEDELILALPVVALDPATAGESDVVWSSESPAEAKAAVEARRNPFASLGKLKQ